ncbi:hypothetical protein SAMN06298212_15611 [Ruaniaceae bacterium KH17]|nr:hypothetical protein SAMN06298212_15611 [Ruaniaceae bacterium KH17]
MRIRINKLAAGGFQELPAIAASFTQIQDVELVKLGGLGISDGGPS